MPEPINNRYLYYVGGSTVPSQVGVLRNDGMHTDGRRGYLLYGPYRPIDAGEYILKVTGEVKSDAEDVVIDIVDQQGAVTYARFEGLKKGKGLLLEEKVNITEPATQLEVRVFVSENDDLVITGYLLLPYLM